MNARKVVLLTGAGSGLGAAMAQALLDADFSVCGVDISVERLAAFAAGLSPESQRNFRSVRADISNAADCLQAVGTAVDEFGEVDILINNAAITLMAVAPEGISEPSIKALACKDFERVLRVNLIGPMCLASQVMPGMCHRGWGRVINITTSFDTMMGAGRGAYGPSKAGLEALSAIWSEELKGSGVNVNVLVPGRMANTNAIPEPYRKGNLLDPGVMAAPIVWLASPQSDFFSGKRFTAEGWPQGKDEDSTADAAPAIGWARYAEEDARSKRVRRG